MRTVEFSPEDIKNVRSFLLAVEDPNALGLTKYTTDQGKNYYVATRTDSRGSKRPVALILTEDGLNLLDGIQVNESARPRTPQTLGVVRPEYVESSSPPGRESVVPVHAADDPTTASWYRAPEYDEDDDED